MSLRRMGINDPYKNLGTKRERNPLKKEETRFCGFAQCAHKRVNWTACYAPDATASNRNKRFYCNRTAKP